MPHNPDRCERCGEIAFTPLSVLGWCQSCTEGLYPPAACYRCHEFRPCELVSAVPLCTEGWWEFKLCLDCAQRVREGLIKVRPGCVIACCERCGKSAFCAPCASVKQDFDDGSYRFLPAPEAGSIVVPICEACLLWASRNQAEVAELVRVAQQREADARAIEELLGGAGG